MLYLFNNIIDKDIFDALLDYKKNPDTAISKLANFAIKNNLDGNIIKKYLIYVLIFNENPFSLKVERNNKFNNDLSYAKVDIKYFYDLYYKNYDELGECNNFKFNYDSKSFIKELIDKFISFIKDDSFESFYNAIIKFYQAYGVGIMSIYKAFRVKDGNIEPIYNVLNVTFNDLIGYDYQKNLLKENTKYFLQGKPYNNVLLYGDSGTGKSTSIKALLNEYFNDGLRIIEVYKHQMKEISKIVDTLKNRPYHFVIYMDDLSFEENEVDYKYLKSIIEGGIEPKPNNVVIYATSNRRHLIKETLADNGGVFDDLHRSETQAEKLSLAYRFGLQIYYSSLSPQEFRKMVLELAKINKINMKEELLIKEASKWELTYGSLSGRCATQFVNYIINKENNK